MNKDEAASFLGVSVRALERYTQQGKISARYVKGKTRPVVDYDEAELRAFKERLEAELYPKRPTVEAAAEMPAPGNSDNPAHGLARLGEFRGGAEAVALIVHESVAAALESEREWGATAVPIADKLVLTPDEAAKLSGLSRGYLREAIGSKKLKARIIGRGWKVKREDLEAYIRKL